MMFLLPYYRVTLKEVKSFLPKINCKITTSKLNEFYHEIDTRRRMEIGFDDFTKLYQKLIFTPNVSILYLYRLITNTE